MLIPYLLLTAAEDTTTYSVC